MECMNYDDYQQLAVRISGAQNNQNKLLGSGILYLRNLGESPLVLTAAHVLPDTDTADLTLQYYHPAEDRRTEYQFVQRKEAGELQDYEYIRQEKPPAENPDDSSSWDLGIIRVAWQNWMQNLPVYTFDNARSEDPLFIWGFPAFSEEEGVRGLSALISAKADVNNKSTSTISYDTRQEGGTATREKATEGFSGSGVFVEGPAGLALAGVVSRSFGKKQAGDRLKIENSWKFKELFLLYKLEPGFPLSLAPYIQKNLEAFSDDKMKARDFFATGLNNLVDPELGGLTPTSFWDPKEKERFEGLPCSGSRKTCPVYWAGQLAKAYCFCEVAGNDFQNLQHLTIREEKSREEIHIEFLCTEQNWEQCIADFVKHKYFQGPDGLNDYTIYLWNAEKTNQYNEIFKKSRCRDAFQNLTKPEGKYLSKKTGGKYSITGGTPSSCNMGVIGMGRLKQEVINDADGNLEDMQDNLNDLISKVWK